MGRDGEAGAEVELVGHGVVLLGHKGEAVHEFGLEGHRVVVVVGQEDALGGLGDECMGVVRIVVVVVEGCSVVAVEVDRNVEGRHSDLHNVSPGWDMIEGQPR